MNTSYQLHEERLQHRLSFATSALVSMVALTAGCDNRSSPFPGAKPPASVQSKDAPKQPMFVIDAGGHRLTVKKLLFTPDGRELISVSEDATIRFSDVKTGETLRVLRVPIYRGLGALYTAALSPDGSRLAVGGATVPDAPSTVRHSSSQSSGITYTQPIYVISIPTGQIERRLSGHTELCLDVTFSPDGRRLASTSVDETARIWDISSGSCEHVLSAHSGAALGASFSPDSQHVATSSFGGKNRVQVWSVKSGECEAIFGGPKVGRCVAWSPDGRQVATGGYDGSLRLWSTDGKPSES